MYVYVIVVKYCLVSSVSACVTLITYLMMCPFCLSLAGGDHVRKIPFGDDELPERAFGNPLGTIYSIE